MAAFSMANMALFGSGCEAITSFYQELKMKAGTRRGEMSAGMVSGRTWAYNRKSAIGKI